MATATESGPTLEDLIEILAPALGDLDASERLERVLAADDRSEEAVDARFAPLDALIVLFRERLGVAEVRPLDELRVEEVEEVEEVEDIDDLDIIEIATDDHGGTAAEVDSDERQLIEDAPTRPVTGQQRRVAFVPDADQTRRAAELLYEDVLWLFAINDGEGALVSLERLLMLGVVEGEAREFVDINGDKLISLYEQVMGPFSKTPTRGDIGPGEMPQGYLGHPALRNVLDLVDGRRTISKILEEATCSRLRACAALEQLHRARVVML